MHLYNYTITTTNNNKIPVNDLAKVVFVLNSGFRVGLIDLLLQVRLTIRFRICRFCSLIMSLSLVRLDTL